MKLHLPKVLRSALLACMISSASVSGTLALPDTADFTWIPGGNASGIGNAASAEIVQNLASAITSEETGNTDLTGWFAGTGQRHNATDYGEDVAITGPDSFTFKSRPALSGEYVALGVEMAQAADSITLNFTTDNKLGYSLWSYDVETGTASALIEQTDLTEAGSVSNTYDETTIDAGQLFVVWNANPPSGAAGGGTTITVNGIELLFTSSPTSGPVSGTLTLPDAADFTWIPGGNASGIGNAASAEIVQNLASAITSEETGNTDLTGWFAGTGQRHSATDYGEDVAITGPNSFTFKSRPALGGEYVALGVEMAQAADSITLNFTTDNKLGYSLWSYDVETGTASAIIEQTDLTEAGTVSNTYDETTIDAGQLFVVWNANPSSGAAGGGTTITVNGIELLFTSSPTSGPVSGTLALPDAADFTWIPGGNASGIGNAASAEIVQNLASAITSEETGNTDLTGWFAGTGQRHSATDYGEDVAITGPNSFTFKSRPALSGEYVALGVEMTQATDSITLNFTTDNKLGYSLWSYDVETGTASAIIEQTDLTEAGTVSNTYDETTIDASQLFVVWNANPSSGAAGGGTTITVNGIELLFTSSPTSGPVSGTLALPDAADFTWIPGFNASGIGNAASAEIVQNLASAITSEETGNTDLTGWFAGTGQRHSAADYGEDVAITGPDSFTFKSRPALGGEYVALGVEMAQAADSITLNFTTDNKLGYSLWSYDVETGTASAIIEQTDLTEASTVSNTYDETTIDAGQLFVVWNANPSSGAAGGGTTITVNGIELLFTSSQTPSVPGEPESPFITSGVASWAGGSSSTWSGASWTSETKDNPTQLDSSWKDEVLFSGTDSEVVVDTAAVVTGMTVSNGTYTFTATEGGTLQVEDTLSIGEAGTVVLNMAATVKDIELTDSGATLEIKDGVNLSEGGVLTATSGGTINNSCEDYSKVPVFKDAQIGGVTVKNGDTLETEALKIKGYITVENATITGQLDLKEGALNVMGVTKLDLEAMGDLVSNKQVTYYDGKNALSSTKNGYTATSFEAELLKDGAGSIIPGMEHEFQYAHDGSTVVFAPGADGKTFIFTGNIGTEYVAGDADTAVQYDASSEYDRATKLVLNGGSIELNAGLAGNLGIRADQNGTVSIGGGVSLSQSSVNANGKEITIKGGNGATYELGSDSAATVSFASDWSGVVTTSATTISDLSGLGTADSTVILTEGAEVATIIAGELGTLIAEKALTLTNGASSLNDAELRGGLVLGGESAATLTADKVALTGSLTVNNFESSLVADSLEITGGTLDIKLDAAPLAAAHSISATLITLNNAATGKLTCNGSEEITAEGISLAENKGLNGLYDFSLSWDGNSLKLESVLHAETDLKDTGADDTLALLGSESKTEELEIKEDTTIGSLVVSNHSDEKQTVYTLSGEGSLNVEELVVGSDSASVDSDNGGSLVVGNGTTVSGDATVEANGSLAVSSGGELVVEGTLTNKGALSIATGAAIEAGTLVTDKLHITGELSGVSENALVTAGTVTSDSGDKIIIDLDDATILNEITDNPQEVTLKIMSVTQAPSIELDYADNQAILAKGLKVNESPQPRDITPTTELKLDIKLQSDTESVWNVGDSKTLAGLDVYADSGAFKNAHILDYVRKVQVNADKTLDLTGTATSAHALQLNGLSGTGDLVVKGKGGKVAISNESDSYSGKLVISQGVSADLDLTGVTVRAANETVILNGTLTDGQLQLTQASTAKGNLAMQGGTLRIELHGTDKLVWTAEEIASRADCIADLGNMTISDTDIVIGTIAFDGKLHQSVGYAKYFDLDTLRVEDGKVIADRNTGYYAELAGAGVSTNGSAGLGLADNVLVLLNPQATAPQSDLAGVLNMLETTTGAAADELGASLAGASTAVLGMATMGDVDRQLQAIRNRTTTMGVDQSVANEDMPYFNAWINAEGDRSELSESGTESGYELSSWGGTVGFDVDLCPTFTAGMALTAMYGDIDTTGADKASGNIDTYYVSAFARYAPSAWTHTFVATVGMSDISLDRHVAGAEVEGETDGLSFGLMYEVGRVFALTEDGSTCLQPVFNVTWKHTSIDAYTEDGSDLALEVDEQTLDTVTFGLGARLQTVVGESMYNRTSILEARVLAKADVGDRCGNSDVAISALPDAKASVDSAEMGAFGLEAGAGLTIPVGQDDGSIFMDASVELRGDYTNVNGTVGYRINF